MRLDKWLAHATGMSRIQVKRLIGKGFVTVDGETVTNPASKPSPDAEIILEGEVLQRPRARYFMLHKPDGYVCATEDGEHPTVLDLLDEPRLAGLHIAGRLDLDTTGLVLITDDGQWSHRVTSPRRGCVKRYQVELADPIGADYAERLQAGVQLQGERELTRPARLIEATPYIAWIEISEGRYHQVKRMFAALGNRVVALHRERIGGITLDPALAPGEYRPLTAEEIAAVEA